MDLSKIKERLQSLQSTTTKQNNQWKPEAGANVIRIVPNIHEKDFPFIELYFHYNLAGKNYLSPVTFGRPDPIVEFAEKLKTTGNKEDYQLGKKLEPKMRTYAPIIVRGKESEGVKFWGFGKTVYQELLAFINDPDYGDISDPVSGRDIVVEFTPSDTPGTFPKTAIRVKPNQTPVSNDKAVIDKIANQAAITSLYKEPTYDELQEALQKWLSGGGQETSDSTDNESEAKSESVANKTNTQKVDDVGAAFNALFNK